MSRFKLIFQQGNTCFSHFLLARSSDFHTAAMVVYASLYDKLTVLLVLFGIWTNEEMHLLISATNE